MRCGRRNSCRWKPRSPAPSDSGIFSEHPHTFQRSGLVVRAFGKRCISESRVFADLLATNRVSPIIWTSHPDYETEGAHIHQYVAF